MKQFLRIIISIGISVTIVALLLHLVNAGVPEQQRPSVIAVLLNTSKALLLGFLCLYLVTLVLRAIRYRLLIAISGEANVPSLRQIALVTGIRNMLVDLLPARIGELGYVALLRKGYGVGLAACFSSLTISIAFDFLALLFIVLLVVATQLAGQGVEAWALSVMVIAVVLSLTAFAGLFLVIPALSRWLRPVPAADAGASNVRIRVSDFLQELTQSLNTVRRAGRMGSVFSLSILIRIFKYSSLYCLFLAVAQPNFTELAAVGSGKVVSALIGGELGASLPIPSFMSFGVYEAGATLIFKLLGVADQAATAVTFLCIHIWSQLMEYVLGGLLLLVFVFIHRTQTAAGQARSGLPLRRWSMIAMAGLLLAGGLLFLAMEVRLARKAGAILPPAPGQVSADAAQRSASGLPQGFVVFSSNREGNHDIYKLLLPSLQITKLTVHPHTETFPRISPDGSKIVFSRAHQEWVSQRNIVAWDIYMKDLASGAETKLGSNGTYPQWLNDREVTFLQEAQKVIKVDTDSGQQSLIYQTGVGNSMPPGARIHQPGINRVTGELVFTGLQSDIGLSTGHWGTAISRNGIHGGLYNGCEVAWSNDGKSLYQVLAGNTEEEQRIIGIEPGSMATTTLINLSGEFTNEYWPKDSNDGEFMVFGASRSRLEHEHDTADYEIFLWQSGSDSSLATRLTFHTGNDNWPDVHIGGSD